jgi:hypothetical protein
MEDLEKKELEVEYVGLPPRSEKHSRKGSNKTKVNGKKQEKSTFLGINLQLIFIRILLLLFLLVIILTAIYPL